MARDFNGTTDSINYPNTTDWNATAQTISMWAFMDTMVLGYFNIVHQSGDAAIGNVMFSTAAGALAFQALGGTTLQRTGSNATLSTGAWTHLLLTWDGSITAANSHLYKDGSEISYATTTDGATLVAATGSLSLGGRIFAPERTIDGRIAEYGRWNRIISAGEISALAKAYSPLCMMNGLRQYMPLIRDANDRFGPAATLDGTAVIEHPRVIYPRQVA